MSNYYEVLGLKRNATKDDIKSSYRKLALKYHPDRTTDENQKKENEKIFVKIVEAYDILSDEIKRSNYDNYGSSKKPYTTSSQNATPADIFNNIRNDSKFKDFFSGKKNNTNTAEEKVNTEDFNINLKFKTTLLKISEGLKEKINYQRLVVCDDCKGNGAENGTSLTTCGHCNGHGFKLTVFETMIGNMSQRKTCVMCNGTGKTPINPCKKCNSKGEILINDSVEVSAKPGISENEKIILKGYGNVLKNKSQYGDLIITVHQKDTQFTRVGNDIHLNYQISLIESIFGGKIEIPTIYGNVKLTLPEGQGNTKISLKGKGILGGNQIIYLSIYIPSYDEFSTEEEYKLKELKEVFKPKK